VTPPADGAAAADLLVTLMLSTAILVDQVPGLERLSPRTFALPVWARRRTGRSSVLLLRTVWPGLNQRLDLSVAAASFRSRTARTRRVRRVARGGMSPFFSGPWLERIRKIPRLPAVRASCPPTTQNFST